MSEENSAFAAIEEHRAKIDEIDRDIVVLLNKRAGHSLAIRALKPNAKMNLYDPKREDQIFAKVSGLNQGPLHDQGLKEIYETLLKVMKETPSA